MAVELFLCRQAEERRPAQSGRNPAILDEGKDPAARSEAEASQSRCRQNTFERMAREWHDTFKPQWAPTHADDVLRSLERDLSHDRRPADFELTHPKFLKSFARSRNAAPSAPYPSSAADNRYLSLIDRAIA